MIKLPIEGKWSQPNNSDKFGSLWRTKNVNLDEEGYIKLSPRTVAIATEAANEDFGVPVAIGVHATGDMLVATSANANFNVDLAVNVIAASENDGTAEPTLTSDSHACFFNSLWFASSATAVFSRAISTDNSATWTSQITNLTPGVRHYLSVFENRNSLCVTNGNVIKQVDSSYADTPPDLTIPADFEAVGLVYNNHRMGIATRLGGASAGQNRSAYFFVWDGATTEANAGAAVNAPSIIGMCAYKSSFALLTQAGQLLYWNGGGFETLANFPLYYSDKVWGDLVNQRGFGDMMVADGDVIYINVGFELEASGRKRELALSNLPSGVWCFDPKIGLYHRQSPSVSTVSILTTATANADTDVITAGSGTVPATGNIVRYSNGSTPIGGLSLWQDYYVIKLSSSTFKVALTKELALAGVAIDLTSTGSAASFWAFDLVDFGNSFAAQAGAIGLIHEAGTLYGNIAFGGDYDAADLSQNNALCLAVPLLENRGYVITPKIYSSEIEDLVKNIVLLYRPLVGTDSLVVSKKTKDVYGLPVSSTGTSGAEWTSPKELFVTADLSEAKSYFDAGGALEIEIVSGAGAGSSVQVESMSHDDGAYSFVLTEEVLGAASGRKCHFILDNWEHALTITEGDYAVVPIESNSKWTTFKVELRGVEPTIEKVLINNEPHVLPV